MIDLWALQAASNLVRAFTNRCRGRDSCHRILFSGILHPYFQCLSCPAEGARWRPSKIRRLRQTGMRSTRLCLSPHSPRTGYKSSVHVCLRPRQSLSSTCGATRKGIRNGKRTFTSSAARRQELEDYYKVMGLSPESTAGQIKGRYYQVCRLIPRMGIGNAHCRILTLYWLIYGAVPSFYVGMARPKQLSKIYHPDVKDTGDVQKYHRIQNAWHILGKPQER
jgi:hypothetical protein